MNKKDVFYMLSRKTPEGEFKDFTIGDSGFPVLFTSVEDAKERAGVLYKAGLDALKKANEKISKQNVDDPRARVNPINENEIGIYIRKLKVVGNTRFRE